MMKKIFLLAASILWLNAFSQNAEIRGSFDQQDVRRKLFLSRPLNLTKFSNAIDKEDIVIDKRTFNIAVTVDQPEIMYLTSTIDDSVEFTQPIFLQPGYAIAVKFKTKKGKPQLFITGKGAADNQPWELGDNIDYNNYPKDTVPDKMVTDLQNESEKNRQAIRNYIETYRPSVEFIKSWDLEMQYASIKTYYTYTRQRKLYIRQAYTRNIKSWDNEFNRMLANAPLMNEAALTSSAYRLLLKMTLIFNNGQFWEEENADKEKFLSKWYADGRDTGVRSFFNDGNNIPRQKVIEKYFTGNVKEYLYAHLFKMALESGKVENVDSIYADFSKEYPGSEYKTIYDDPVAEVFQSLKKPISDRMIFESDSIKTWAEVLKLFQGKTVLLDMWGTWCGPCREDIKNYGGAIKTYFKDKGLDYLYIANRDKANVKTWKSLITYYKMEGHHILAMDELTLDITKNITFPGYPAYVIIHKNGSFELTKAGMSTEEERKILIAQVENALK